MKIIRISLPRSRLLVNLLLDSPTPAPYVQCHCTQLFMSRLIFILFITIYTNFAGFSQGLDRISETEAILNFLRNEDLIDKRITKYPWHITDYQFEGNYSVENVFPDLQPNTAICVVPIRFSSSISAELKKIDEDFDQSFYQEQIKTPVTTPWKQLDFSFDRKLKFGNSFFTTILFKDLAMISHPIFNKKGTVAAIRYDPAKESSRIYLLQKSQGNWTLKKTIRQIRNW